MRRSNQKNRSAFPDSTFDTFEPRKLLSAVIEDHWLVVTGTSGDDLIVVTQTATKVKVDMNDEHHSFNGSLVENVRVEALAGDDTIRNSFKLYFSYLYAGAGDDLIYGGNGPETIYADSGGSGIFDGNDTVYAGAGGDDIISDRGSDYIDGGNGDDWVDFQSRSQGMTIDLGGNPSQVGTNTITLKKIEGVLGTKHDDHITGNSRNNGLNGNGGNDVIFGLGGDDEISVSDGASTVRAGSGNDEIDVGNLYDDEFNVVFGEGGNDSIHCGDRDDHSTVYGGSGDDIISGNNAEVFGGDVYGHAGNDTITYNLDGDEPGPHSRIIDGGSGSDHLKMSTFDGDVGIRITLDLIANDGRRNSADACNVRDFEWLTGGRRADLFDASLSPRGVRLDGLADHDTLIGSNYADSLYGGEHNDSIRGNDGDDLLEGSVGNDKLNGGLGIDTLLGWYGNDTISAADGLADIIDGGDGTDEADIDEGLDQTTGVEVLT